MTMCMRGSRSLLIFIAAIICASGVFADDGYLKTTTGALNRLREGVKVLTLPNGLRVIMYKRGEAPIFSGVVAARVGGVDEPSGKTGIAHMLEHMAFKGTEELGTKDYDKEKQLLEELETLSVREARNELNESERTRWSELHKALAEIWDIGDFTRQYEIRGGQGMNAYTSKDLTVYMVNMPKSAFEFWCWIESERILHPVLRQFYQERDVVMEERRMRFDDDPSGKLYEALLGVAFLAHPYRQSLIGYAEDIRHLTASETRAFHDQYYVPENIVVSLVGDIDFERDEPIVRKYFSRMKPGKAPPRPTISEPSQEGERTIAVQYPAAPQVFIAYRKPNFPHRDDAAIGVLSEMLGGNVLSPLYRELVERKKIASGVGVDEEPGSAFPNLLLFSASISRPHTIDVFVAAFDRIVKEFLNAQIRSEELAIAKRSIAMAYLKNLSSSMSLAIDLASSELLHGGWGATLDWYEQAMAVTESDVKRVGEIYLQDKNRTIARLETLPSVEGKK
jgi:predicted Zn-dependent peptidase